MFLPPSLLLLVSSVLAQQATQLPLNQVINSDVNASSNPSVFAIPSAQGALNLSVSLCTDQIPFPRFILTNDTSGGIPKPGDAGNSIYNITLDGGLGIWSGMATKGGFLAVYPGETLSGSVYPPWTFQVALSDSGPVHDTLEALPLLGDTTSTQSLLFSEAFAPYTPSEPTYPDYTLPAVNLSYPDLPKTIPNFTLALLTTSSPSVLSKSACAIQVLNSSQNIIQTQPGVSIITRGSEGFRTQWIVEGLRASSNYTAFVVQDGTKISSPIFFQTKSSRFKCSLLHSLPFCPQTAYSVPLPPPPSPATTYDTSNLDVNFAQPFLSALQNFSSVLSVFPCGRDVYSPIQTCTNCLSSYRQWLCAVTFPQCADTPSNPNTFFSPTPPEDPPAPALMEQNLTKNRSPILPPLNINHTVLLPCLEVCHAVDRACPPLLGWRCPLATVNANESYGVGFVDSFHGQEGGGRVGGLVAGAVDRWGGQWCSGL